ncbi:hypothetical protein ABIB81_008261, partial [Bradyrhizobium sp. I1.7.5]
RIVGNMEAAPAHHAFKIDVKHQSNGPQSYAYGEFHEGIEVFRGADCIRAEAG